MKQKKSAILKMVHDSAVGLYDAGVINASTMRTFDVACLEPVQEFSSSAIKQVRLKEKVSQSVFAAYLNTSISTVKQWETGEKRPRGASLKLLNIVAKRGLIAIA